MDNSHSADQLSNPCISDWMKGLKIILGGRGGGDGYGGALPRSRRHSRFLDDDDKLRQPPQISLDDQRRGKKDDLTGRCGHKRCKDNDATASRGLPDSMYMPSYPPCIPPYPLHVPVPVPCNQRGYRLCSVCKQEVGNGNCQEVMGNFYHPQCFCCCSCGYPITEKEFSISGRDPYHKSCFEITHPKCQVCHRFIPTNASGLFDYRCHPYWSQKYCSSHEHDNTARCCSCERFESWNTRYIDLGDGRSVCLECMESAIMDIGDCQPLYHSVRDYYEGMNMRINQQIPMFLVERQALNEAIVGEKNRDHHIPEIKSLCLAEEQIVTSILRRPRIGGQRLLGIRTQPHKLIRRCEVTAILVLYGLPRLLTGAILAHELMHAWLRLQGYRNLSPEVEKGICQYLSYMWLESEVPSSVNILSTPTSEASSSSSSSKKGRTSAVEQKLGRFYMHKIESDASPAYGGGFRSASATVNKYGLRSTLEHIRLTGSFPI